MPHISPTAAWPQLRASLALAIVAFASREGGEAASIGSAERMLDALSESDGPLPALRAVGDVVPSSEACAVAPQVGRPFTDDEIASICLSRRHDFGLMPEVARIALMDEARAWELAFAKERELIEMRCASRGAIATEGAKS